MYLFVEHLEVRIVEVDIVYASLNMTLITCMCFSFFEKFKLRDEMESDR